MLRVYIIRCLQAFAYRRGITCKSNNKAFCEWIIFKYALKKTRHHNRSLMHEQEVVHAIHVVKDNGTYYCPTTSNKLVRQ